MPEKCPAGSFGNTTGLRAASECTPCSPGHYCQTKGLTSPTGQCRAGYYCISSSQSDTAVGQSYAGGICPAGGYCPAGSSESLPCLAGFFSNVTGLTSAASCQSCLPGYYCAGSNKNAPTGQCLAGWYCTVSARVMLPTNLTLPTAGRFNDSDSARGHGGLLHARRRLGSAAVRSGHV